GKSIRSPEREREGREASGIFSPLPHPHAQPLRYRPPPPKQPLGWHPLWLAAAIVLTPVVFWLQQYSRGLHEWTLADVPREKIAAEEVTDPGISGLTLSAKSLVRMSYLMRSMHEQDDDPSTADDLEDRALSRVDRLRVAIVSGELEGSE